jgi:hypothetical protein
MTEIETDLRAWMQERATRVHASRSILETDYRPRTASWRPRTASWRPRLAIGGGVAAIAATVTAVLTLAGGASTAFAGWSAQPTAASAAQLQAAESVCSVPGSGLSQQLVDSRGPYTIIVYQSAAVSTQTYEFCTDGPWFESKSSWNTSPPVTPAADQLYLWSDTSAGDNEHPYGAMIAQAGAGVTAVNVTLTDGSVVTATVQNGWVVAWWPGHAHVVSAQLTTPTGTQTQTFATYPCDVDSCGGGAHGGAADGGPGGG